MSQSNQLKFGVGNAKLNKLTAHFSLPSGWTCPSSHECHAKADPVTGRIQDGPHTKFRCFSASQEAAFPAVRRIRQHNLDLLRRARTTDNMVRLIEAALPDTPIVRVHVAGDFFNQSYFLAWMLVAERHPQKRFYAYTKELKTWTKALQQGQIPRNFSLVASRGGRHDHLIDRFGLREAIVVNHPEEAEANGWPIDHDDSLAANADGPTKFALLLHGTQPRGSAAAEGIRRMKQEGVQYAYTVTNR